MANKIPPDALEYYVSLGPSRSYQAVAERYEVSKRAVTKRAAKENWQERMEELERKIQARREKKVVENRAVMDERHLKFLRAIQARALEALKSMPLSTAMEAVRALDMAIKRERVVSGEPAECVEGDTRVVIEYTSNWREDARLVELESEGAAHRRTTPGKIVVVSDSEHEPA